jgi:hypothetical protein
MIVDPALFSVCAAVLRANDLGDYTRPSPRLYPHQWNWDSAFAAIGWAHLDWPRAVREVDALLAGQWVTGMLPQIRYNPRVAGYAPGPEWWPDPRVRRAGERTSGISQPPVLPTAVYLAGLLHPVERLRTEWWERVYKPLLDALRYFSRDRTTAGSPLIVVIHPWESGLDNSPRWDAAVRKGLRPSRPYRRIDDTIVHAEGRPTGADYDLYLYLVEHIAATRGESIPDMAGAPFAVYDALFNAIWYRAAVDLNRIAQTLGRPPAVSDADLRTFRDAYHTRLWSDEAGLFRDYDLSSAAQIPVDSIAGLGAIWGGLVDASQAAAMLTRYQARTAGCRMLASVPPDQPGFDPVRYWRGPVWVNTNWFVARGLEALGVQSAAHRLAAETLELVSRGGPSEYFHAHSGAPLGGRDFTWSAALSIDLLRRPIAQ